jgi:hypothetical protein
MVQGNKDILQHRGQGLIVVDADTTVVDPTSYYLANVDGKALLVDGQDVKSDVLARVLLVIMPPRPSGQVPEALDV